MARERKDWKCQRCAADPQPKDFGSPRECAFFQDGSFCPNNWNCATMSALMQLSRTYDERFGDNSIQVIPRLEEQGAGFVVLSRYKQRGETSSAVLVGDFWPVQPVTLQMCEAMIDAGD